MYRSEGNSRDLVLFFYQAGPGDGTRAIRLGGKRLYQLSHCPLLSGHFKECFLILKGATANSAQHRPTVEPAGRENRLPLVLCEDPVWELAAPQPLQLTAAPPPLYLRLKSNKRLQASGSQHRATPEDALGPSGYTQKPKTLRGEPAAPCLPQH